MHLLAAQAFVCGVWLGGFKVDALGGFLSDQGTTSPPGMSERPGRL